MYFPRCVYDILNLFSTHDGLLYFRTSLIYTLLSPMIVLLETACFPEDVFLPGFSREKRKLRLQFLQRQRRTFNLIAVSASHLRLFFFYLLSSDTFNNILCLGVLYFNSKRGALQSIRLAPPSCMQASMISYSKKNKNIIHSMNVYKESKTSLIKNLKILSSRYTKSDSKFSKWNISSTILNSSYNIFVGSQFCKQKIQKNFYSIVHIHL